MRPAIYPLNLVEPYLTSGIGIVATEAVIQHPVVTVVIRNQLGMVSRSCHQLIAMQHYLVVIVQQRASLFVDIGSQKILGATNCDMVGTAIAFATAACGTKQIIIVATLVNVNRFHKRASHLLFVRAVLDFQSVIGQLNGINAAKTSPEEVLVPSVFVIKWVDAVLHTYFFTDENGTMVGERSFGFVGCCHANATRPLATPL